MKTFALATTLVLGSVHAVGLAAATPALPATTVSLPAGGGARIQFAALTHDFGRVSAGEVVKHEFVFTNTGTAPLEITGVRPGCGCTTAGTWDKRVEPGQTGRIPLQLNSTGFSGTISKGATVTCNDPAQTNVYLTMQASIWRPIEVTPQSAYFNLSEESVASDTRVVRIVNNLEAPLTLSPPESSNPAFRTELKTLTPGKEFELHVSVQPPLPTPRPSATVTLKTSATNLPLLTVPVSAYVQPAISVVPSQVMLPAGPLTTAMQPTVTIRNTGTNALALSDATVNLEGASVTLREVQPGRVFTLAFSLPAGLQLPAGQRVVASVKSNHPRHPQLEVPVFQSPRTVTSTTGAPTVRSFPQPAPSRLPTLQPPPMLARPPEPPTR